MRALRIKYIYHIIITNFNSFLETMDDDTYNEKIPESVTDLISLTRLGYKIVTVISRCLTMHSRVLTCTYMFPLII